MLKLKKMKTALNKLGKSGMILGVGSVLNIHPVYNKSTEKINCHPDLHVLKTDWNAIGGDFNNAGKEVKK